MKAVQVLERKEVIRWFGVALMIAPIVNTLFNVSLRKIGFSQHAVIFTLKTTSLHILALYVASFCIGAWMMKGRTSSWRHVLFLLGSYILIQLPQLAQNIKANKLMGLFFLVNVFVFYFIADQLVFKIKVALPKTPKKPDIQPVVTPIAHVRAAPAITPTTTLHRPPNAAKSRSTKKRILLSFEGVGPWAELSNVSAQGIQARALRDFPFELRNKPVEIYLAAGLPVLVQFKELRGGYYYFEFAELSTSKIQHINQWLQRIAS